jgi:hypothetical protein
LFVYILKAAIYLLAFAVILVIVVVQLVRER